MTSGLLRSCWPNCWACLGRQRLLGPFSPVFVSEGLTLDFIQTDEDFPVYHFCFRVSQQKFDEIIERITHAGIPCRSSVRGPMDMQINTDYGGSMIYWNQPDGHQWEMLTVSYARQASQAEKVGEFARN